MRLLLTPIFMLTLLAACSSPKTTYYAMNAEPIKPAPVGAKNVRVMVGPVSLPEMIDQPQIVTLGGDNQVRVYEYDRWAGSLKSDVGRVIASNIARDLGTSNVWNFAQSTQTNFDYQVLVDVQNLQSKSDDSILVDVLWTVKPFFAKPQSAPLMGRSLVQEKVTGSSIEALVQAQTRAFAKVSQEIAQAIR